MAIKRVLAFLIDYILLVILLVIGFGLVYLITKFTSEELSKIIVFSMFYIGPICIFLYIGLKDLVFKNQSIGKKIFEIKVVSIDEKSASKGQLISRNFVLIFLFWVEVILIFISNKRLGDSYAKTKVVEV